MAAEKVLELGKEKAVCYCVDGSAFEDRAAQILLEHGAKLIDGRSKASFFAEKAGIFKPCCAVSAHEIGKRRLWLPLIVYDLCRENSSHAVELLCDRFGKDASAAILKGEGAEEISLFEAENRRDFGVLTGLAVYEAPLLERSRFDFEDFLWIMRRLREPDGCPWDRVQTHESIRINAIEEAYELVDAIDHSDPKKICEEAGDVLMQAIFHTLIEEESGNFTVADMLSGLCEKLISRHTHVFGQDKAAGADGALSVWEKNKMIEKSQKTFSDSVNDVPECFPALLRAQKIAKRMEKGGWDKASLDRFEREFSAEYKELLTAVQTGEKAEIAREMGDVLMCIVNLARAVGADAEMSLLDTVKKLQKRYTEFERLVRLDKKDVLSLSDEEREEYYRKAKDAART